MPSNVKSLKGLLSNAKFKPPNENTELNVDLTVLAH